MNRDQALRILDGDSKYADLIEDSYMDANVELAARRFSASEEFQEVKRLLANQIEGKVILDLGAGNGIASFAFSKSGARRVFALEPSGSPRLGREGIRKIASSLPIEVLDGYGEEIPVDDLSVDVVFARSVLHHAQDLGQMLKECARVLKEGGTFLACREHVVDNESQMTGFLKNHPINWLTQDEYAYSLDSYLEAIRESGLSPKLILGPWDSLINAFPRVRSNTDFHSLEATLLVERFGFSGRFLASLPGSRWIVRRWINRPVPGRMFSFLAVK